MTELKLYKFIKENDIEWHWENNDGEQDVVIFPMLFHLADFIKLFNPGKFDDGGIPCHLCCGYMAFWMQDICDYYGIDILEVFPKQTT